MTHNIFMVTDNSFRAKLVAACSVTRAYWLSVAHHFPSVHVLVCHFVRKAVRVTNLLNLLTHA